MRLATADAGLVRRLHGTSPRCKRPGFGSVALGLFDENTDLLGVGVAKRPAPVFISCR
jgi:hypothetical protein